MPRFYSFAATIAFAILAWIATETRASQCPVLPAASTTGTCVTYPTDGLCGPILGGQQVYLGSIGPQPLTIPFLEAIAVKLMNVLAANRGIVDNNCRTAGDMFICNSVFLPCQTGVAPNTAEAIPSLLCENICDSFWNKCQAAFDAFFFAAIQTLGQPTSLFAFPHCAKGTWTQAPQPVDFFGARSIPGLGPFPIGYNNQTRYPVSTSPFRRADNSILNVACKNPTVFAPAPLSTAAFAPPTQCLFPLVEEAGDCKIPCPFPVIPVDQQNNIGLAFVVPACIALFLCMFVFADSLFVIASSQGFDRYCRPRKLFRRFGSTTNDTTDENTGSVAGTKSGSNRRRSVLRAATLYSLLGAILGIVYFMIGPLVTLIRGNKVSCGTTAVDQNLDLLQFILGQAERSDAFCRAQRIAPFVLQMIFNLILYAIVRVFMVVTEKSRRMSSRQLFIFDIVLLLYTAGIPILFLILAATRDVLSTNLVDFITQFSRNSAICVMRLSVADEIILVFMPFIVTGTIITIMSYYIYTHLAQINQNVKGIVGTADTNKGRSSSAVALRLLMLRLSALGVFTFMILLVFISATASLIASMANFSPKFNAFFLCTATQATTCKACDAQLALMLDALPSPGSFAAQLAAMSSITLLFGGFFSAQSVSRLYKEYQDGSLSVKATGVFCCRRRRANSENEGSSWHSFSAMGDGKGGGRSSFIVVPEVPETCVAIWRGRFRRWRQSMANGRARGPVFRFAKGPVQPKTHKPAAGFSAPAWTSKPVNESNIKWQGVVASSPTQEWSSTNSSFVGSPGASGSKLGTSSTAYDYNKDPSWSYSDSKLSNAARSNSINPTFGERENSSYTRREHFDRPPKLPEI